jgi:hypothetical protein
MGWFVGVAQSPATRTVAICRGSSNTSCSYYAFVGAAGLLGPEHATIGAAPALATLKKGEVLREIIFDVVCDQNSYDPGAHIFIMFHELDANYYIVMFLFN